VGQCLIIWAPENKGNKDKLVCWSFVWVCTSLSGTTRRSQRKGLHMKDPILTGIRISSLVRGCNGSNKTNLCRMIAIGNYVQLLLVPVLSTDTPILSKIYLICVKITLILDFTQYAHLRCVVKLVLLKNNLGSSHYLEIKGHNKSTRHIAPFPSSFVEFLPWTFFSTKGQPWLLIMSPIRDEMTYCTPSITHSKKLT
jgi:hypothetical protein